MPVVLWLMVHLAHVMAGELDLYVIESRTNYSSAITSCRSKGYTGLAILDTAEKFRLAIEYIDQKNVRLGEPWVGLQYIQNTQDFFWNTGDRAVGVPWRRDEPDYPDIQLCVRIRTDQTSPGFGTSLCYAQYFALCERYDVASYPQAMYVIIGKDTAPKSTQTAQRWIGIFRTYTECCFKCEEDPQCAYVVFDHVLKECKTLDKTFSASQTIVRVGFTIGGKFVQFRSTANYL